MSIVYRKVTRDLLRNKTRTLLVVLSTAVGVLALGIAVGGGDLMDAYITSEWRSFQPAHIVLSLNGAVGDDTATARPASAVLSR